MNTSLTPVFVYGTLRNGFGNYSNILAMNTIHEEPATLVGATMYDAGGCPFVSLDPNGGNVTGEVMYLDPETARHTMIRLDRLEGFSGAGNRGNMYDRILTDVTLADGSTLTVYTYVTGNMALDWTADMPIVASGDWTTRRAPAHQIVETA